MSGSAHTKQQLSEKLQNPVVMACGLVLLMSAVVAYGGLSGLERGIFNVFYGLPSTLWPLFMVVTQLGSVWFGVVSTLYVYQEHGKEKAQQLMYAVLASFVVVEVLKRIIHRPRPNVLIADVSSQDILTRGGYGFPSGHAAEATVLAIFAWHILPRRYHTKIFSACIAVWVSRLYLGMHLPLDIIGGVAIGLAVSKVIFDPILLAKRRPKA